MSESLLANPTYQGLLDAILAEPDEDVHRLVAADWLDDHGQPERAEFIRVQVKLDNCPICIPTEAMIHEWTCGHRPLRRRERELWDKHCRRWLGIPETYHPLEFLAASLDQYQCGFVESVRCTGERWWGVPGKPGHGPEVVGQHPVKEVQVTDVRFRLGFGDMPYYWHVDDLPRPIWEILRYGYTNPETARTALSTAALAWAKRPKCRECGGLGQKEIKIPLSILGTIPASSPCRPCHGYGREP